MHLSIKKRIYWSFYILASIFVINGIITVVVLNYNRALSKHVTEIVDPSLKAIVDFRKMLLQSQMYSTNWVFIRSNQGDKDALVKLQTEEYPSLKKQLNMLSMNWYHQNMRDSLQNMFGSFEGLLVHEKYIMAGLVKFEDYDDVIKKFSAEGIVENEVLPHTSALMHSLNILLSDEQGVRIEEEARLEGSAMFLRILITILSLTTIGFAVFFSVYMGRIIIRPINKIISIVNDLGRGVVKRVDHYANGDEMGEMIRSVNHLAEKLGTTAAFAREIGNRNFHVIYEPLSDEDNLGKALLQMRDNLRASDDSLNEAQNIAHLGSWERDLKTNHFTWSDEIFRIYEVDRSSFNPKMDSIYELIHPEDREKVSLRMNQVLKDNQPYSCEFRITTAKGNTKIIYLQTKPLLNEKSEVIKTFGTLQDITEQKQAELALGQAHRQIQTLFENIEEVFFSVDMVNSQILQMSPACEKVYGYPREDFFKNPMLWYEVTLDEDKKIIDANNELMKAGKSFNQEYRIHHRNSSVRWIETKITPTLNKEGTLIRIDGVTSDTTKRREAEETLKSSNAELKKTNSELDKFVYSVSHDLRAPLTSMLGVIELSEEDAKDDMLRKHLAMLKKSVNKLDGFILDILDYSRNSRTEVKVEEINFKEMLEDITDNLKYMSGAGRHVEIKQNITQDLIFISDKGRLGVVLNNLISNAIRYQNQKADNPFVEISASITREKVIIVIKDNGIGISEDNRTKVFDMFYRISDKSVGSGLGLYIVKETIDKLKGTITINSELGKGSEFIIDIPNN